MSENGNSRIFVAFIAMLLIKVFQKTGYNVEVRVDGKVVKELPLDKDTSYVCETYMGVNTVLIEGGEVHVTDADCPDKICEDYKPISKVGEAIICLPHKLVVEVVK